MSLKARQVHTNRTQKHHHSHTQAACGRPLAAWAGQADRTPGLPGQPSSRASQKPAELCVTGRCTSRPGRERQTGAARISPGGPSSRQPHAWGAPSAETSPLGSSPRQTRVAPGGHRQPHDTRAEARSPARPGRAPLTLPGLTGPLHSDSATHTSRRLVGHVPSPSTGESRAAGGLTCLPWRGPVDASGHVESRSLRLQRPAKSWFSSERLSPVNPRSRRLTKFG